MVVHFAEKKTKQGTGASSGSGTEQQQQQPPEEARAQKKKPVVPLAQLPRSLRRRMYVPDLSPRPADRAPSQWLHAASAGSHRTSYPRSPRTHDSELRRGTAGWDVDDPGPGRARRLETHAWHAKRMRMSSSAATAAGPSSSSSSPSDEGDAKGGAWGFCLPLSATRKPSKATVRAARGRSVLHDASYTRVLELSGAAAEGIAAVLGACLDPVDAAALLLEGGQQQRRRGARMAEAVLHRPGAFPQGALGPVRWLWRPPGLSLSPSHAKGEGEGEDGAWAALWLWLHPAFADEVHALLQARIAAAESPSVRLRPIPDLLLLELRGPGAHPLLRRALQPATIGVAVTEEGEGEGEGNALWAGLLQHVSSARPETFPAHGAVLALRVRDPREAARPSCRGGAAFLFGEDDDGEEEQQQQRKRRRRRKANKTRRLRLQALLHGAAGGAGAEAAAAAAARSSLWSGEARAAAAAAARSRTDAAVNARRHRARQAATWQGALRPAEAGGELEAESGVPVLLVARGGRGSKGLFLDGGVSLSFFSFFFSPLDQ